MSKTPSEGSSKKYGDQIRITTYVSQETYEALKLHAEPGEKLWQARLLRKVIRDWLASQQSEEIVDLGRIHVKRPPPKGGSQKASGDQ